MRKLIVGVVLCLGVATIASAQSAGEKVYADNKCGMCHSIGDKGNKKGPLDKVGSKLKADEIKEWITDAKAMTEKTKATRTPAMKSYPTMAKGDLDALVAYLQTLK